MKLFGLSFSISRSSAPTPKRAFELSPDALGWLQGQNSPPAGPILSNAYEQVVWVYRAINALAEQVANIPFLFSAGDRGRESLITSGPLVDFYHQPHPHINRFQYWELRILWLMLRGECMRIPIFDDAPLPSDGRGIKGEGHHSSSSSFSNPSHPLSSGGEGRGEVASASRSFRSLAPSDGERVGERGSRTTHHASRKLKSVLLLDPAQFQHIVQDGQLMGWRFTGSGKNTPLQSQVFLPEEVWFERLPNPFDFWRGLPPLRVADLAAQTDFAAGAFMRGLIENNADLGLIVRTAEHLDDSQREQILAQLRNRKRRAGTADTPLLLWDSAEVIKPQLSSSDLQFLDNRRFSRSEICAAFGVPEEIVATTENSKYDVMAGARQNFIENRIAPLCARLEAEENCTTVPAILGSSLNHQRSTINPPVVGWFDLDSLPIMQQARRNRLAAAKLGFDMGIPLNELNRLLDLGVAPLPWGNTGYLPAKYQPLGQSAPVAAAPAASPPPEDGVNAKLPSASPHATQQVTAKPAPSAPAPNRAQLLQLVRELNQIMRS